MYTVLYSLFGKVRHSETFEKAYMARDWIRKNRTVKGNVKLFNIADQPVMIIDSYHDFTEIDEENLVTEEMNVRLLRPIKEILAEHPIDSQSDLGFICNIISNRSDENGMQIKRIDLEGIMVLDGAIWLIEMCIELGYLEIVKEVSTS